jgi:hypothetical protein
MKLKATLVLLIALGSGAGAFTWRAVRSSVDSAVREPELRWLQREFSLSDDVALRIAELHRTYTAECEPMCSALRASDAETGRLFLSGKEITPDLAAALTRSSTMTAQCQHRMIEHFYAVAREMPEPARARYLALMMQVATHPERGRMKVAP